MKIPSKAERHCTSLSCPEGRSICCNAPSRAAFSDEGTGYFVCKKCEKEFIGGKCTAGNCRECQFEEGHSQECSRRTDNGDAIDLITRIKNLETEIENIKTFLVKIKLENIIYSH